METYETVVALARRQDDVVTCRDARRLGMSAEAITLRRRRHGWRSPIRGTLFVPPVRDELRACARAVLALTSGTICGLAAARLHGLPGLFARRLNEPVDVAVRAGVEGHRQRSGYRLHRMVLDDSEVADLAGLRVSSIRRTLEDLALLVDREEFVSVLDAMLQRRLLAESELPELRGRVDARRYGRRARDWWVRIDGRAESPLETRLRLLLGDAGLLPEESQWPVYEPRTGRFVARLDFAWPSARVAVEADGVGPHGAPEALYRDRDRQNALVRLGWEVLRFTWRDVVAAPRRLTAIVAAALRDAAPA